MQFIVLHVDYFQVLLKMPKILLKQLAFEIGKIIEKVDKLSQCTAHKESLTRWSALVQTAAQPHLEVSRQIFRQSVAEINSNRHAVATLARTALFCGRQDALRGHFESLEGSGNKGNFLELLDLIKKESSEVGLKQVMDRLPSNATL